MTPSERGRMLWKLGDAFVANVERLAEIERRDNGKLASEVTAQVRYMGDYFKYYAGLADKIHSAVIPDRQEGRVRVYEIRAEGRHRDHHAVEFAVDADELETCARARRGLHRGRQAFRVHIGFDAGAFPDSDRRGPAARRAERGHWSRPGGRRSARDASGRGSCRLHRRRRRRSQDLRAGGARPQDGDAGARRQVAEHRVRRCGSRPGGQGRRVRDLRRFGPELSGGIAAAACRRRSTTASLQCWSSSCAA